jgi:hypothetical protein
VAPSPIDVSTLRELYTTPPAQFVAERTRLVKESRAAKEREAATALGKLRKPALVDWALNVVATEHGDDVAAFLDAAGAVRDAQAAAIEGRKGPDVRGALRDLRDRSGRVLGLAQEVLSGAGRDAAAETGSVAGRLTEISASSAASAQLAAGVLGSAVVVPADVFAGLEAAPTTPDRRATRTVSPRTRSKADAETEKEERQRKRQVAEATKARDVAARAADRANAAVDKAAAALRNLERQLDEARETLDAAELERDDADRRLGEAEDALRRATDGT